MGKQALGTDYGNWVSGRLIYGSALLGTLFLGLSFLRAGFIVAAAPFVVSFVYFMYAQRAFSSRGRGIQEKLWDVVLDRLEWSGEGRALDIGCGNGPLTITLARRYAKAHVTGIDTWGTAWGYAEAACARNAEAAGVAGRVEFRKASASALPFCDGFFDAAVSNFVFHEVSGIRDKRVLIREALRVVRKGGRFAFQDLFLSRALYGGLDDLIETIRGWGITEVSFLDTSSSSFIPRALKLPFMTGKIGILFGTK